MPFKLNISMQGTLQQRPLILRESQSAVFPQEIGHVQATFLPDENSKTSSPEQKQGLDEDSYTLTLTPGGVAPKALPISHDHDYSFTIDHTDTKGEKKSFVADGPHTKALFFRGNSIQVEYRLEDPSEGKKYRGHLSLTDVAIPTNTSGSMSKAAGTGEAQ